MRKHKKVDYSIVLAIFLLVTLLFMTVGIGLVMAKYKKENFNNTEETVEYENVLKTVDIS